MTKAELENIHKTRKQGCNFITCDHIDALLKYVGEQSKELKMIKECHNDLDNALTDAAEKESALEIRIKELEDGHRELLEALWKRKRRIEKLEKDLSGANKGAKRNSEVTNLVIQREKKLQSRIENLRGALKQTNVWWNGMTIALEKHAQNINVAFFLDLFEYYQKQAKQALQADDESDKDDQAGGTDG